MPKTGGTSFRKSLEQHFDGKLLFDYDDLPLHKTHEQRMSDVRAFQKRLLTDSDGSVIPEGTSCIYGHFLALKYKQLLNRRNVQFVTWLREPAERLASHYHHWVRNCGDASPDFVKKIVKENWSLAQFCMAPEMRNTQSLFLQGFSLSDFAFVGITAHYHSDFAYFSKKYLGKKQWRMPQLNVNRTKKATYFTDKDLLAEIRQFHDLDYTLYQEAVKMRTKRLS